MLSKSSINTSNCTSMNSVSVIIPVYGVENYIEQCLQSIIHQTMDHRLIECIIINDCTQDRSMEVAQEVIANYTGEMSFRIINHQVNRGLSVSRNTGIKEAKNDYLMFIDSDDYLLDDGLTRLMMMAEQQENDIVMGNFYDETKDCLATPYKEDLWSQDLSLLYIGIHALHLPYKIQFDALTYSFHFSNLESDSLISYQGIHLLNCYNQMAELRLYLKPR